MAKAWGSQNVMVKIPVDFGLQKFQGKILASSLIFLVKLHFFDIQIYTSWLCIRGDRKSKLSQ